MSIKLVKVLIFTSQFGRIWSKNRMEIKILQSLTAVGFLALFFQSEKRDREKNAEKQEIQNFNNTL